MNEMPKRSDLQRAIRSRTEAPCVEALEGRRLLSLAPAGDYAIGKSPVALAVGDLNGDGLADVVTADSYHVSVAGVSVLLAGGGGAGVFAPAQHVPAGGGPASVAIADLTGDGKPDLAVATGHSVLRVLAGRGDGTFTPAQDVPLPPPPEGGETRYGAGFVAAADLNGDGNADLVATYRAQYDYWDPECDPDNPNGCHPTTTDENFLCVLLGDGSGGFTPSVVRSFGPSAYGVFAVDVLAADFNGDRRPDLAVAADSGIRLFLATGGTGDASYAAALPPVTNTYGGEPALAGADFTGDGKLDLAAARGAAVAVLEGKGDGTFQPAVLHAAGREMQSVAVADLNLDGRPDLIAGDRGTYDPTVGSYVDGAVNVLVNAGGGSFRDPAAFAAGPAGYAYPVVATGDFDGDGRPDVAAISRFGNRTIADGNLRPLLNDGSWPAAPVPSGPEFLVHAPSTGYENFPDVATDAEGNFVVVWNSQSGALGDPYEVYGRRFGATGQPLGAAFLVSSQDGGSYTIPAVAMDRAGNFVVAWGSGGDILARRFDALGRPRAAPFLVNTLTARVQEEPSVAMDADGDFVVAWQSTEPDGNQVDVYARQFSAAGTARGAEFRVNTYAPWTEDHPSVAMDAAGAFIVAWRSDNQNDSPFDIYAQRYDAAGARLGGEFRVNTTTAGQQDYPAADMDAGGNFVVAWQTVNNFNPGEQPGPYFRHFAAGGLPSGPDVLASSSVDVWAESAVVAMTPTGGWVVGWNGGARAYSPAGQPLGPAFPLATVTNAAWPALAARPDGGFVAAWWYQSSTSHGIDDDIYARVFTAAAPPPRAAVVGRHVFYNRSGYDGDDAAANLSDDAAIAPDKVAVVPGELLTFANVTSYSRGINGVMVEITGLAAGVVLTADDFSFRWGRKADRSDFADGPAPASVTVRPGEGAGGSDRVTLAWGGDAVRNGWLEVTVKATADTGLATPDVFSFGNLVGDTGNSATSLAVNVLDSIAVRRNLFKPSMVTGRYDFNRDGRVGAVDLALVRMNYLRRLQLLGTPAAAAGAVTVTPPAADRAAPRSRSFYTSLLSPGDGGPTGASAAPR